MRPRCDLPAPFLSSDATPNCLVYGSETLTGPRQKSIATSHKRQAHSPQAKASSEGMLELPSVGNLTFVSKAGVSSAGRLST